MLFHFSKFFHNFYYIDFERNEVCNSPLVHYDDYNFWIKHSTVSNVINSNSLNLSPLVLSLKKSQKKTRKINTTSPQIFHQSQSQKRSKLVKRILIGKIKKRTQDNMERLYDSDEGAQVTMAFFHFFQISVLVKSNWHLRHRD